MSIVFIKSAAVPRTVRRRPAQTEERSSYAEIAIYRNALACWLIGFERDRVTGLALLPHVSPESRLPR